MTQRRHHYEVAFEDHLRARRIPYVAVDEAKKSLLPGGIRFSPSDPSGGAVKSFDFVLYGESTNLLVEVKGRRIARRASTPARPVRAAGLRLHRPPARSCLQNWVTSDDVSSLLTWERLFGTGFEAAFVFVYWCDEQPPDALFQEVFENRGKWYALRTVLVTEYARSMRTRSERWRTVHIPTGTFEQISRPFAPPTLQPRPFLECGDRRFPARASGLGNGEMEMYRGPVFEVPDDAALVPHGGGAGLGPAAFGIGQ